MPRAKKDDAPSYLLFQISQSSLKVPQYRCLML